jgi:hypothetical protein
MTDRLRDLPARPVDEYPSFPVALGEAHDLPGRQVVELLRERIRALEANLEATRAVLARADPCVVDRHHLAEVVAAERGFPHRLVVRIENGELAWPSRS